MLFLCQYLLNFQGAYTLIQVRSLSLLYLCGPEGYQKAADLQNDIVENQDYLDTGYLPLLQEIQRLTDVIWENKELLKDDKALRKNDPGRLKPEEKKQITKENQEYSSDLRIKEEEIKNLSVQVMFRRYRDAVDYLVKEVKETVLGEITGKKIASSADLYWIDYIDDTVKKLIFDNNRKNDGYRFQIGYLYNHVWKEWTQYMASKYIELGKAVYHFAVPDLSNVAAGQPVSIGEVSPEYQNGISSFEYERIKAQESLEREMAEYVAFAVNNFARAVAPDEERAKEGHEDVLCMKAKSEISQKSESSIMLYKDADRRILQFFGGKSHFENKEDSVIPVCSGEDLYIAIRNELNCVRNMTFHYTTTAETGEACDHEIASWLFEEELNDISTVFRKKYYSNNVPEFYSVADIDTLMQKIYSGRKYRAAQIPAFNKIISRPALPQIMNRFVKGNDLRKIKTNPDRNAIERYWSCLFFVLKEIYYYDFLQKQEDPEKNVKARFFKALKNQLNTEKDQEKKKALEDFSKRIESMENDKSSFGEVCQVLMVDYMLQNTGNKMVRKQNSQAAKQKKDSQIYKHYRTILYICLREAFMEYLKENWQILREPHLRNQKIEEKQFCDKKCIFSLYDHIRDSFGKDASSSSWYIAAHFINPKYLNHLIGSIRNYLQFTADIERRAGTLHNRIDTQQKQKEMQYQNILEILEFTIHFCGQTTHEIGDYFELDQDSDAGVAYAKYLFDFVDCNVTRKQPKIDTALRIFCDRIARENGDGIYYDGANPILNKNIIQAKMYGNSKLLKNSMERIKYPEIKKMFQLKSELDSVLKEGVCRTEEEQKKLREFQNSRNRIELLDVSIYTEILNDMYGQLINWSYMRERDLMYYQLGYYYTKLFWTDSIAKDDVRRRLSGGKVKIEDGAILYQILAINSYTLPVIANKNGEARPILDNGSIGGKAIGKFLGNYINDKPELFTAV